MYGSDTTFGASLSIFDYVHGEKGGKVFGYIEAHSDPELPGYASWRSLRVTNRVN